MARATTPEEPVAAGPAPRPGTKVRYFGDYELLEEIAHGGMGVVWKARQMSLDRVVALKMIQGGPFATQEFIKRFEIEAKAAAQLQHRSIVAIHEVGVHEGHHYYSMDYVEGPSLAALVRGTPLPPKQAARYLQIVAQAIHYAHEHKVLHRDLKPANVLIDWEDQPRITDFGLAKRLDVDSGLESAGRTLGTLAYMPPEQVDNKPGAVGPYSDVYSLGATFYHMLTGRPPFQGEEAVVLEQVRDTDPVAPRRLNPSVPKDLETVCLKCLRKEPRGRYSSARELAEDLRRWEAGEPIRARPVTGVEQMVKWVRRKPGITYLVAAALVALFATGLASTGRREMSRLWQQYEANRLECFAIADHLQKTVLQLNNRLILFELHHDPGDLKWFRLSSKELKDWIEQQKITLRDSPDETKLLREIDGSYDRYLSTAASAVEAFLKTPPGTNALETIDQITTNCITILDQGYDLEEAHRNTVKNVWAAAREAVIALERAIVGRDILLFLLLVLVGLQVYRKRI